MNGLLTIPLPGTSSASAGRDPVLPTRLREFVAGPENALAATAFARLLECRPHSDSPLVLYGPLGSGKTHLAYGLGAWWRDRFPGAIVHCASGGEFAGDLAAAVAAEGLLAWREQIRAADLFVLDDLSELTDKRAAQQELLHTLDVLARREATVVVTARSLPSHWPSLLAPLRGRLSEGLAVGLALPSLPARRAILERLLDERGFVLPPPAINQLAVNLEGGVPRLAAAILELEMTARLPGQAIDREQVRRFVTQKGARREPSLREIAVLTGKHFGFKLSELKSPVRRRPLVVGRGVAMFLARQLTSASLEQIGNYFGGRDHTTVLYGCRRTEELRRRDRAVRQAVAELKRTLAAAP